MNRPAAIHVLMSTIMVSGMLLACSSGSGPSDPEFVQACVKTQATEAMCECAAREARSSLSSGLYTAMGRDMQGRKQEVAELAEKLSFDERAAFAMQQF